MRKDDREPGDNTLLVIPYQACTISDKYRGLNSKFVCGHPLVSQKMVCVCVLPVLVHEFVSLQAQKKCKSV